MFALRPSPVCDALCGARALFSLSYCCTTTSCRTYMYTRKSKMVNATKKVLGFMNPAAAPNWKPGRGAAVAGPEGVRAMPVSWQAGPMQPLGSERNRTPSARRWTVSPAQRLSLGRRCSRPQAVLLAADSHESPRGEPAGQPSRR